ncbi:DUF4952 domain-containing protein [Undibacterium sp. Ji50W]|uniref:DUF4952 domain-containing protein n=1 Tax=Undibacterium sp. Ji50W TaxID=3413041 RepID=UPI003BF3593C
MHTAPPALRVFKMAVSGIMCLMLSVCMNLAQAANPNAPDGAPVCVDFLQQIAKKPASLEFMSCEATMLAQIHVLRVRYRVAGPAAARVEDYFVTQAHMGRMKRACCLWETLPSRQHPGSGRFASGHEFDYSISMASEETLVSRRADWPKIKWFYVMVELPLESP